MPDERLQEIAEGLRLRLQMGLAMSDGGAIGWYPHLADDAVAHIVAALGEANAETEKAIDYMVREAGMTRSGIFEMVATLGYAAKSFKAQRDALSDRIMAELDLLRQQLEDIPPPKAPLYE